MISILSEFYDKLKKNKIIIFIIIFIGIIASIYSYKNIKVAYKSEAQYQMAQVTEFFYFSLRPRLLFDNPGSNIHLVEKMHRLIKNGEITVPKDCHIGSIFDDSNEYSRKRNQLGFNPGYFFQISRVDFIITISYSSKDNNTEACLEGFIKGLRNHQQNIYKSFKNIFDEGERIQLTYFDFADAYAKKYKIMDYFDEWEKNSYRLTSKTILELYEKGANPDLAIHYFRYIQKLTKVKKNIKKTYYKKLPGKIITGIKTTSLMPNKFIVVIIINFIAFALGISFVLIKEYEL